MECSVANLVKLCLGCEYDHLLRLHRQQREWQETAAGSPEHLALLLPASRTIALVFLGPGSALRGCAPPAGRALGMQTPSVLGCQRPVWCCLQAPPCWIQPSFHSIFPFTILNICGGKHSSTLMPSPLLDPYMRVENYLPLLQCKA